MSATERDAIRHGRFAPLFDNWELPSFDVREATRFRQGVYVIRKRGVVRYVGSSVADATAAPLRMWKTIMRHFQTCAPAAPGRYGFGSDNWCTSSRADWQIQLLLVRSDALPETVRALEDRMIAKHAPNEQAQKKPRETRKPRRKGTR